MFIVQKTDIFESWFSNLRDLSAKAKILSRIKRIELGNLGDHKSVGGGISEIRIDYGPGYRLYFVKSKGVIIILVSGGDKSTQSRDIKRAQEIALSIGA